MLYALRKIVVYTVYLAMYQYGINNTDNLMRIHFYTSIGGKPVIY